MPTKKKKIAKIEKVRAPVRPCDHKLTARATHKGSAAWLRSLEAWRLAKKLTRKDLAAHLGISRACYRNWRTGTHVSTGMRARVKERTGGAVK